MKVAEIKKIRAEKIEAFRLPELLDSEGIGFHSIDKLNWKEYSYAPEVSFRMAYTEETLLLHYRVKEQSVRARYGKDNEPVWTDSCVECFFQPEEGGDYYNIECNCAATLLIGVGKDRQHRELVGPQLLAKVERWASLGSRPFEERPGTCLWEVALVVPSVVLIRHPELSLTGKTFRGNFYKCGDELTVPHFLSWNPIEVESPDFHRPEFFGQLRFG